MPDLWSSTDPQLWQSALEAYDDVIVAQGVRPLAELDRWYRETLPAAIAARRRPHVTHEELVRVTEWKMARGVWRARNLALVRGNPADRVEEQSAEALAAVPDLRRPVELLAELDGVGPATASAVVAAASPDHPFFDELVAAQVPGLVKVAFSAPYYARYAEAIRARAAALGPPWTPVAVERALWAFAGGKAGQRR